MAGAAPTDVYAPGGDPTQGRPFPAQQEVAAKASPMLPQSSVPGIGGALLNGFAAGRNAANQNADAGRQATRYKGSQITQQAVGEHADDVAAAIPGAAHAATAPAPAVHPSVLGAVVDGIKGLFGGQPQVGAIPAPAAQQPIAAMSAGGVVTPRADPDTGSTGKTYEPRLANGGAMPYWRGADRSSPGGDGGSLAAPGDSLHPPGDSPAATRVLTMDAGGAVPAQPSPMVGQTAIPGVGGALVNGAIAGRNLADQNADAGRQAAQYSHTEAAHGAMEDVADHLAKAALNDAGRPQSAQAIAAPAIAAGQAQAATAQGGQSAIPADPNAPPQAAATPDPNAPAQPPASQNEQAAGQVEQGQAPTAGDASAVVAVQGAAANPNAQAGIPQDSPQESGKVHSLTHQWYAENDAKMMKAVAAAARAGYDPKQVMDSMLAMRNGFFQSNMLRNASAANIAALNGDNAGVEKAIRDMYYYVPDGQELKIQHGKDGQVVFQDPVHPYLDDKGNEAYPDGSPIGANAPGAKANMIPVTPQYLQMLGTALMDPQAVGRLVSERQSAAATQHKEYIEAQAKLEAAHGENMRGHGVEMGGQARLGEVAATNVLKLSEAQWNQARAATSAYALNRLRASNPKLDPGVLRGAQAAASAVDEALLGNKVAAPISDADGNPSLSPAAGKVVHDPRSVPPQFQNITPLQAGDIKANAQGLYAANAAVNGMTPQQAAQIALAIHTGKGKTHPNPTTKKQEVDSYVHPDGEVGVWDKDAGKYRKYHIDQGTANSMISGDGMKASDFVSILSGNAGGSGGGAIPSPNPVDTELNATS